LYLSLVEIWISALLVAFLPEAKPAAWVDSIKEPQTIHGTSLFDMIHAALAPQVDEIVVSANVYADYFLSKGCRVVTDRRNGFLGPLSGIESVLLSDDSIEWLFCCPVDTPFIPETLVASLLSAAKEHGVKAVSPMVDGKREPLHSLIHASLLPTLTEFLDGGERSVGYFLRRCDHLFFALGSRASSLC